MEDGRNCLRTVFSFVHVSIRSVKTWVSVTVDILYIFLY